MKYHQILWVADGPAFLAASSPILIPPLDCHVDGRGVARTSQISTDAERSTRACEDRKDQVWICIKPFPDTFQLFVAHVSYGVELLGLIQGDEENGRDGIREITDGCWRRFHAENRLTGLSQGANLKLNST